MFEPLWVQCDLVRKTSRGILKFVVREISKRAKPFALEGNQAVGQLRIDKFVIEEVVSELEPAVGVDGWRKLPLRLGTLGVCNFFCNAHYKRQILQWSDLSP